MIFLHQQEIKEFQIYEIQRGSRAEAGQGAVRAAHRLLIHQCLGPSQPAPPGSCSPQKHSHCSGRWLPAVSAGFGRVKSRLGAAGGGCSTLALRVLGPRARSFPRKQLLPLGPPAFHLAQHLHHCVHGEPFTPSTCWSVWLCQNISAKLVRSCYEYMCWLIKQT